MKTNNIPVNGFQQENSNIRLWILLISSAGILLRLFHYWYNRSLWMDEIYLSSSFLHFSYSDLATRALDHDQKAPIGFLWLVKLTVDLFGKNEMALRLIPLLAGIASVLLFAKICRYFLSPVSSLLAVVLFAFAPALIYHSVEIKQYSTECLATVIALYLYIRFKHQQEWKDKILWGACGAVTLWFSYSVIFVLAGIAGGMTLNSLLKKDWKILLTNLVPFFIWLISFVINYLLFTHRQAESQWVVYFFKTYGNFMPLPPYNLEELKWFPRNLQQMMDYPLGLVWDLQNYKTGLFFKLLSIPVIPVIVLFTGIISLFRSQRKTFFVLLIPVILMLFASGILLYPLTERFWVFIAPVFILFIAFGFEFFSIKYNKQSFSLFFFTIIAIGPVIQSVYFVIQPEKFYKHKKSLLRESLVNIDAHFRKGDVVYNYWNNYPGFDFYTTVLPIRFKAVEGRDVRKQYNSLEPYNQNLQKEFQQFKGKKRVWVIYNTLFMTDIGDLIDDPKWYYQNNSPTENLVTELKKVGKPVKKIVYPDVTVYLFELY